MNFVRLSTPLAAALLATSTQVLAVPASGETTAVANNEVVDLIQDRPNYVAGALGGSVSAVGWVWNGLYDNVLSWVIPPSPKNLTASVTKDDAVKLFKLLGYAGYKLKEIDTQVGIIPTISFKFGQIRELSEADYDYLDIQMDEWYRQSPGFSTNMQRGIVNTVIAVNSGTDYQVSSLKVQLLPLPKVAFSVSPKITALGEESSALMRAIQRVDRHVQERQTPSATKDNKK